MAHITNTWKFATLLFMPALMYVLGGIAVSHAGSGPDRNVDPGEAQAMMRENAGNRDFVVLDVRTPGEFARGHLEDAVLVDFRSPGFRETMKAQDRTKTYLVYCRTGNRSGQALKIMKELGFRNTYHLEGGIKRWVEDGLPAVR